MLSYDSNSSPSSSCEWLSSVWLVVEVIRYGVQPAPFTIHDISAMQLVSKALHLAWDHHHCWRELRNAYHYLFADNSSQPPELGASKATMQALMSLADSTWHRWQSWNGERTHGHHSRECFAETDLILHSPVWFRAHEYDPWRFYDDHDDRDDDDDQPVVPPECRGTFEYRFRCTASRGDLYTEDEAGVWLFISDKEVRLIRSKEASDEQEIRDFNLDQFHRQK